MEIRNKNGKKVCVANPADKSVEILIKGCLTRVMFLPNGTLRVTNQ